MGKLLQGFGINDVNYDVTERELYYDSNGVRKYKITWYCPYYLVWRGMIERCYGSRQRKIHPSYNGCYVCDEWRSLTVFRHWMETQEWFGKQLDKDILVNGNKLYSPETCVFVSSNVNKFILDRGLDRGAYKIGVCYIKSRRLYKAQCADGNGKNIFLGHFATEEAAHSAWRNCKYNIACKLAEEQLDARVADALRKRYAE